MTYLDTTKKAAGTFVSLLFVVLLAACNSTESGPADTGDGDNGGTDTDTGTTDNDNNTDTDTDTDADDEVNLDVEQPDGTVITISTSTEYPRISVLSTGQRETTRIAISVAYASGNAISESDWGDSNTVRLSLRSAPNGSEYLEGLNASGDFVYAQTGEAIDVVTDNGSAAATLRAGTLPGIVEIRAELLDTDGVPYPNPVVATMPQVAIASGPAHAISVSLPRSEAIVDLNEATPRTPGFYRRNAGINVTDRWGNVVADGTVVYLGLIDTVIASGTTGSGTSGSGQLTDGNANFETGFVMDNKVHRFVEETDRVLIDNALPEDKSRFVKSVAGNTSMMLNSAFNDDYTNLEYRVGASLLGASIAGIDADGQELNGYAITKDGKAALGMTYPANSETILNSATVILSSNEKKATTINNNFSFAAIAGFTLEAIPKSLSGSGNIELTLEDGGDGIRLPGVPVTSNVEVTNLGDTSDFEVTVVDGSTDPNGQFSSTVTVSGGSLETGDSATITYRAGDASVDVTVTIP